MQKKYRWSVIFAICTTVLISCGPSEGDGISFGESTGKGGELKQAGSLRIPLDSLPDQ